jgi:hypothetical protein
MRVSPNIAFWIVEGIGEAKRHSATMRQPLRRPPFMIALSLGLPFDVAPQPFGEEIARQQERDQTAERRRRHDDRDRRHAVHHAGRKREECARHRHQAARDEHQRQHGGRGRAELAPATQEFDQRFGHVYRPMGGASRGVNGRSGL